MEYEKGGKHEADESGYNEKKTDILVDSAAGKGLPTGKIGNIIFSKKSLRKKTPLVKGPIKSRGAA